MPTPRTAAAGPHFVTSIAKAFGSAHPARVLALAPSLLAADFANLSDALKKMLRARCYWTHLDVMDGHFVPNITFGPPVVQSVRKVSSRLFLDTHLMIEDPLRFLGPFVEAGANLVTIHAEAVDSLPRAVAALRAAGVRAGVSLKPGTAIDALEPVLDQLDLVLLMTVEPGFGGQGLLPSALSKVRQLASLRAARKARFLIQVDGGINPRTAGLAVAAGANVLVAGTAVFGSGSVAANLSALLAAALPGGR